MEKREYKSPLLKELGSLSDFTKQGWSGEGVDGAFPENTNEVFGIASTS